MVGSKSGRRILTCEICNKSLSSRSRGKYWLQILNGKLLTICYSCKKAKLFKVSTPDNLTYKNGLLFCCSNNNMFKVIITNNIIITECFKCMKKTAFKLVKWMKNKINFKEITNEGISSVIVSTLFKSLGALAFMIVWNLSIAAKLGFPKIGYITALFIVLLGWILKGSSRWKK